MEEVVVTRSRLLLSVTYLLPLVVLSGCMRGGAGVRAVNGSPTRVEALSLLGRPLFAPELTAETRTRLLADLSAARAAYDRAPNDADAIIWLGRRLAYLGQYREAIETFSEGLAKHPADARLYRHRGHRYITTRQLNRAITDLQRAAELIQDTPDQVEPDGAPNRYNIPLSTLHSNVWYHLALAHYLRHDFDAALPAWERSLQVSTNDDMIVASADWLYMTMRRLGRDAEATELLDRIRPEMQILENDAYHRRLLMYKGLVTPESLMPADTRDPVQLATYGYGLANWYLVSGDSARAHALFARILEGTNWAAFGYIAAESEMAARQARSPAGAGSTGATRQELAQ
jgi:tetratricopeptide (TPR) repeat protein